jgi:hypothetical protein
VRQLPATVLRSAPSYDCLNSDSPAANGGLFANNACTRDRLEAELCKVAEELRGEVDWEVG